MLYGKKIVVVMPAYNAEKTLKKTYHEIDLTIVDEVILVDDHSKDATKEVAKELNIKTLVHTQNQGYGGNQKTCYRAALETGADIVIMLHPDYQYTPQLLPAMAHMIASGVYDCVLGSRILGGETLKGGMPLYKYFFNRALTFTQNILMSQKASEYHTGYRGFSRKILETLPLGENENDFVFDNEMLAQVMYFGFKVGELSCPTKYFPEASSINFKRSVEYGLGVLRVSLTYFLCKRGLLKSILFSEKGRKLNQVESKGAVFHPSHGSARS
jgi:glycosyltransferase involved in cell wall biosynthesis